MEIRIKKEEPIFVPLEGVTACELRVALPYAEGKERAALRVGRFYGALLASVQALFRQSVIPLAEKAYRTSDDPRKRVTWRPLCLRLEARAEEGEGGYSVTRTLTLSHRARTLLCERWEEWILPDGLILPLRVRKK